MRIETFITRGLEIWGALFMGIVTVVSAVIFAPFLLPQNIYDLCVKHKEKIQVAALVALLVVLYVMSVSTFGMP